MSAGDTPGSRVAADVRARLDSVTRRTAMNQDAHKDLPAFIIVSPADIAARAYGIYLDRGAADGFDREDWVRAEQELRAGGRVCKSEQHAPRWSL
jgi:hypothetical protein